MGKLATLMEAEGFDNIDDFCAYIMSDNGEPGICMNKGCDYITNVEPDCHDGWCENCETNTVKSATELILF